MKRGGPLQRKTPLTRAPMQRKASKKSVIPQNVRAEVAVRSDGRCEAGEPGVCTGSAEHMHHILMRSRGGKHTPDNLLHCCNSCHAWVHQHPIAATARDWLRHNWQD